MTREDGPNEVDGEARVTPLERHARWLLRCYPDAYRHERSEEIIGTLLEATPAGRAWPRLRDVRAMAIGGLKARAAQNRQRTVGANLRVAVMAGLALYLSLWIANYLAGVVQGSGSRFAPLYPGWSSWPAAAAALLTGATIVLAWTAPRVIVLIVALAASAGVAFFGLVVGGPHALLGPSLLELLALAGLAALAPRSGHSSRHWLWLPGLIAVSSPLMELGVAYGWFSYSWQRWWELSLLAVIPCGLLWVAVDARLMIAVLALFALIELQVPVEEISSGFPAGILASLPILGVVAAIAAATVWVLRRQSARPVR
jgi:hypothetical protein